MNTPIWTLPRSFHWLLHGSLTSMEKWDSSLPKTIPAKLQETARIWKRTNIQHNHGQKKEIKLGTLFYWLDSLYFKDMQYKHHQNSDFIMRNIEDGAISSNDFSMHLTSDFRGKLLITRSALMTENVNVSYVSPSIHWSIDNLWIGNTRKCFS